MFHISTIFCLYLTCLIIYLVLHSSLYEKKNIGLKGGVIKGRARRSDSSGAQEAGERRGLKRDSRAGSRGAQGAAQGGVQGAVLKGWAQGGAIVVITSDGGLS